MSYEAALAIVADWAAIGTAAVASIAYGQYLCRRRKRRLTLERYLQAQKSKSDKGQRSIVHLIAHVGMPETDIFDAAFNSSRIRRRVLTRTDGIADEILLEYVG